MKMNRKIAIVFMIICAILWSTGGLFIKLVDWNPVAIAGARSGIASVVMMLYLRRPVNPKCKVKIMGALVYSSLLIMFVCANKLTTSANAILLQFTSPIWVAFFRKWFLKEKNHTFDWICIFFIMIGMTLFFVGDLETGNIFGNIIAVLSGVSMAGLIILLKIQKEGSPVEIVFLGNIVTFIIAIPFFFLSIPSFSSILGLLALGIFQVGISYILYTEAIRYVSSLEAILIPIIEPLLNPIWVLWFAGEAPSSYAIYGGLIVITAIILRGIYGHKKSKLGGVQYG